jgi:hypothetical protein
MAFNFPDGASSGDTHTASNGTVYRYNGTTWLVDSATTTSTFDSKYLNTNGDGILSGSVTNQLPSGVISGSSQLDGFVSSSSTNIIEVMTSASYAGITPVSGTLYIIQG